MFSLMGLELEEKYTLAFQKDNSERMKIYSDLIFNDPNIVSFERANFIQIKNLITTISKLFGSSERGKKEATKKAEGFIELIKQQTERDPFDKNDIILSPANINYALSLLNKFPRGDILKSILQKPLSESEVVNLLKGVLRFGEHQWSMILGKYPFSEGRTPLFLFEEWKKIRFSIMNNIEQLKEKGISASKNNWINAYIRLKAQKDSSPNQSDNQIKNRIRFSPPIIDPPKNTISKAIPLPKIHNNFITPQMMRDQPKIVMSDAYLTSEMSAIYRKCINHFANDIDQRKFDMNKVQQFLDKLDFKTNDLGIIRSNLIEICKHESLIHSEDLTLNMDIPPKEKGEDSHLILPKFCKPTNLSVTPGELPVVKNDSYLPLSLKKNNSSVIRPQSANASDKESNFRVFKPEKK